MDFENPLPDDLVVHRIGGALPENLCLKEGERKLKPPGISVLLGGTPKEAAKQMRGAFPHPRKHRTLQEQAQKVGTATVGEIREAGFDVLAIRSDRFANHGRLIHPSGSQGFSELTLIELTKVFAETAT